MSCPPPIISLSSPGENLTSKHVLWDPMIWLCPSCTKLPPCWAMRSFQFWSHPWLPGVLCFPCVLATQTGLLALFSENAPLLRTNACPPPLPAIVAEILALFFFFFQWLSICLLSKHRGPWEIVHLSNTTMGTEQMSLSTYWVNDSTIVPRSTSLLSMIIMEIVGLDKWYLKIMKLEVLFVAVQE